MNYVLRLVQVVEALHAELTLVLSVLYDRFLCQSQWIQSSFWVSCVCCVLHAAEVGGSVDCPLALMWTLAPFVFRCHVVML